ncbi:MAG: GldG family protein [Brevinematia bacterium]
MKKISEFLRNIKISRRLDLILTFLLILLNLFMLAGIFEKIYFRIDLTNDKKYSLSTHTKDILKEVKQPLTIKVFFSQNLPAPYNSYERYLRDLLDEYKASGRNKIKIDFVDLKKEPDSPKDYGIYPVTLEVVEKDQLQYKKAYLGVAFIYGDLIEKIPQLSTTEGLEYRITSIIAKMINKVNAINNLDGEFEIYLFGNTKLPIEGIENLQDSTAAAILNIKNKLNGKVYYKFLDTYINNSEVSEMIKKYKFPAVYLKNLPSYNSKLFPSGKGYIGILVKYKDNYRFVNILEEDEEGNLYIMGKYALEENLMSTIENLLAIKKKVGYLTGHGEPEFIEAYGSEDTGDSVSRLSKFIDENYEFKPITILKTPIPDDIDVLLIVEPKFPISRDELFKIDQFIMSGKPVIFFVGGLFFPLTDKAALMAGNMPVGVIPQTGLYEMLSNYGIIINHNLILDKNCYKAEIPKLYGGGIQDVYYAPIVEKENISQTHPITKKVKGMFLIKTSSLSVITNNNLKVSPLVKTSTNSWQEGKGIALSPAYLATRIPDKFTNFTTAAVIEGGFKSYFASDPNYAKDRINETQNGKMVVVASGDMAKNVILDIDGVSPNSIFVRNIIDWAMGNSDLISLRIKGLGYNPPKKTTEITRAFIKWFNTVGTAIIVVIIGLILWQSDIQRRKKIKKLFLEKFYGGKGK